MATDDRSRESLLKENEELRRQVAELEARQSETDMVHARLLDLSVRSLPVVLFRMDEDGIRTESMGVGLERCGFGDHEAIGTNALAEEQQRAHIERALAGETVTFVTNGDHEGQPWWYLNFVTFDSVRGRGAIGLAIDITGQKEAEATLAARDHEHRRQGWVLQSILDNIGDGVVVADAQGRFTQFNPEATHILGIGATDASPGEWSDQYGLFLPDGKTPFPSEELPLARAIKGESSSNVQMFIHNPNRPQGVWISVTAQPMTDRDGKLNGGVCVFHDITARKQAEESLLLHQDQLRSMTAELLSAEESERKRLAADLHDGLGQLLTLVSLKLDGLLRLPEEANLRTPVKDIREVVQQANEEVRSLTFQLSPPILHDLGLGQALDWLAEDLQHRYGLKVVVEEIGKELTKDERIRVVAFRALRELLINVAKHACIDHAYVTLTWSRELLAVVEDHGAGFDTKALNSESSRGFGLFLISERLERIGGRFNVQSKPGEGTTVTLALPLETGSFEHASSRDHAPRPAD